MVIVVCRENGTIGNDNARINSGFCVLTMVSLPLPVYIRCWCEGVRLRGVKHPQFVGKTTHGTQFIV